MHVTPTDFRDLARSVKTLDKEAILAAVGQGTLIWKPTKKVADRLLGFPSVHIIEWRESFCTNFTWNRATDDKWNESQKSLLETVVNSIYSLFNWLFCQVGAHAKPFDFCLACLGSRYHFHFPASWECWDLTVLWKLGRSRGLNCPAFSLGLFTFLITSLAWLHGTRDKFYMFFTPELAGFWLFRGHTAEGTRILL